MDYKIKFEQYGVIVAWTLMLEPDRIGGNQVDPIKRPYHRSGGEDPQEKGAREKCRV